MSSVFFDAHVSEGAITYRTGMTVYEERFCRGTLIPGRWNGAGFSCTVAGAEIPWLKPDPLMRTASFAVEINGMSQNDAWEELDFSSAETTLENGTPVLECVHELKNRRFPLRVRVVTVLDGTAVFERKLIWSNDGADPLSLSRFCLLGGILEQTELTGTEFAARPEKLYSLGYFDSPDWAKEGLFRRRDLPADETAFSGRYRRTRHRHPAFLLNNRLTGSVFFAQLAYSAGYTVRFEYVPKDTEATLAYEILLDGGQPSLILRPGETFATPSVHMGRINGSDDEIIQQMHDHIRRSVFTLPEATRAVPGGTLIASVGPEDDVTPALLYRMADQAAEAGVEDLTVDAGWYCPPGTHLKEWRPRVGDWYPDPTLYPEKLKEISDYAHSKGLLFGLWIDPERMGTASAARKAHPEWIARPYGDYPSDRIDLTIPEAAAWVENELCRIFEEYSVDLFRLDNNVSSFEIHSPSPDGEDTALRYYAAVYGMYERLRRKYPHIIFENCAGGGGRTDLGMVRLFSHTWVSDHQAAPRGMAITNGMTMVLPPERVDRLFAGMDSWREGEFTLCLRNGLFGKPTMNLLSRGDLSVNPIQMEAVKHALDLFKTRIRPWAPTGKIWHHTPECFGTSPSGNLILERSAADRSEGILGYFALSGTAQTEATVFLKGIDRTKIYEVTFDNSGETLCLSGYQLAQHGLNLRVPSPMSSELILYRAIREK